VRATGGENGGKGTDGGGGGALGVVMGCDGGLSSGRMKLCSTVNLLKEPP